MPTRALVSFTQMVASSSAVCWAHVRRHFYDLEQAHASPLAQESLRRIAALYKVEDQIRGKPPEQRRAVRQAESKPRLDSLRQWMETTLSNLAQVGHGSRNPLRALASGRADTLYRGRPH